MKPSPLHLQKHFFTRIQVDAHRDGDPSAKPLVHAEVDVAPAHKEIRRYQVTLRLKLLPQADKKPVYTAEVHVVGVVVVAPSWPEPDIDRLVRANATAILYGAAREMLCNLTARGPWPMLCLHSVSFIPPKLSSRKPEPDMKR